MRWNTLTCRDRSYYPMSRDRHFIRHRAPALWYVSPFLLFQDFHPLRSLLAGLPILTDRALTASRTSTPRTDRRLAIKSHAVLLVNFLLDPKIDSGCTAYIGPTASTRSFSLAWESSGFWTVRNESLWTDTRKAVEGPLGPPSSTCHTIRIL